MKFFLFFCLVAVTTFQTINSQVCLPNQYYDDCGSPCELTCDNYQNPPEVCAAVCKAGCFCEDGFVKLSDTNSLCVTREQCEVFDPQDSQVCLPNQYYSDCGPYCELTCDNYQNPPQNCPAACKIGCFCYNGYVKLSNTNSLCVTPDQCKYLNPPGQPICPPHQHYTECGTYCQTNCQNYGEPPEACIALCYKGCVCDKGYIKETDNESACILPRQCPSSQKPCYPSDEA